MVEIAASDCIPAVLIQIVAAFDRILVAFADTVLASDCTAAFSVDTLRCFASDYTPAVLHCIVVDPGYIPAVSVVFAPPFVGTLVVSVDIVVHIAFFAVRTAVHPRYHRTAGQCNLFCSRQHMKLKMYNLPDLTIGIRFPADTYYTHLCSLDQNRKNYTYCQTCSPRDPDFEL